MFIIHDIQAHQKTVLDNARFGSQEMEQRWIRFFGTVLDGVIKMWISVASVCLSSIHLDHSADNTGCLCFCDGHCHSFGNDSANYTNSLRNHDPHGMR